MLNYQDAVQTFDLNTVANNVLSGSLDALNACYECCDRYADTAKMVVRNNTPLHS